MLELEPEHCDSDIENGHGPKSPSLCFRIGPKEHVLQIFGSPFLPHPRNPRLSLPRNQHTYSYAMPFWFCFLLLEKGIEFDFVDRMRLEL